MAGSRPVVIMRGHELEKACDRLALSWRALARWNDPAVPAHIFDVAAPQARVRINGVALVQRPAGRFRLLLERPDHPGAGWIDAAFTAHERGDRARCIHVLRTEFLGVDAAEVIGDGKACRRVQLYVP